MIINVYFMHKCTQIYNNLFRVILRNGWNNKTSEKCYPYPLLFFWSQTKIWNNFFSLLQPKSSPTNPSRSDLLSIAVLFIIWTTLISCWGICHRRISCCWQWWLLRCVLYISCFVEYHSEPFRWCRIFYIPISKFWQWPVSHILQINQMQKQKSILIMITINPSFN